MMEPLVRAALQAALPAYEVNGDLGRDVAAKELPAAFAADPVVRDRFVSEAQMVASTDVATTTELLEGILADGGVVVARGPLGDDGEVAELSLSTYVGDFTYGDTPDIVNQRLALLGLGSDLATTANHGGRDIVTITTDDGASVTNGSSSPTPGSRSSSPSPPPWTAGAAGADAIADTVTSC